MLVRFIVPALALLFAGAASAQATAPTPEAAAPAAAPAPADAAASDAKSAAAAPPKQRCHKEYRVGSNIPKTVCETEPESTEDRVAREHALEELKHAVRNGAYEPGH